MIRHGRIIAPPNVSGISACPGTAADALQNPILAKCMVQCQPKNMVLESVSWLLLC